MLTVAISTASAQYTGLATSFDGTQVFLTTTYIQPASRQTADPKVFRLENGQAALLATQACDPVRLTGACGITDLQVGGTSAIVYQSRTPCMGGSSCILRETGVGVLLTEGERRSFEGRIRISRNGRYLINHDTSGSPGPFSHFSRLFDLQTGDVVNLGDELQMLGNALRVADDGSVLMSEGWIVRRTGRTQIAKPPEAVTTDMDGQATVILAENLRHSLFAVDVLSQTYRQIGPSDRASYGGSLSDDGKWLSYISVIGETPQLFFSSIDGQIWRQLTSDTEGVETAVLSGNGRTAVVLTRRGTLLRIDTSTAAVDLLVHSLPHEITPLATAIVPGSLNVLKGRELSMLQATAAGVWPDQLGDVRLTIGETAMRLASVSPIEIVFQVPWDLPLSQEPLLIDRPSDLFKALVPLPVQEVSPLVLSVLHEDFTSLVSERSPARVGEIVHIFGTGFGRVEPVPASGDVGSAEPLSRVANGWVLMWDGLFAPDSSLANVTYFGLAPGLVGVYQADIRIPERRAYSLWFADPLRKAEYLVTNVPVIQ